MLGSLLMVGQNTPNEMWVRVVELIHQAGELFLVPLRDSTEQALLDSTSERVGLILGVGAVSEQVGDVRVTGSGQETGDIVIQGIFVLF